MTKYDESYLDDYAYDEGVVFCHTNVLQKEKKIVYSGDLKSDHLKSGFFEGPISNCGASAMAISYSPKFEIWMILSGFQMFFDKKYNLNIGPKLLNSP